MQQPRAESSSFANQPPCMLPSGFKWPVSGVPWKTAPWVLAEVNKKFKVLPMCG